MISVSPLDILYVYLDMCTCPCIMQHMRVFIISRNNSKLQSYLSQSNETANDDVRLRCLRGLYLNQIEK